MDTSTNGNTYTQVHRHARNNFGRKRKRSSVQMCRNDDAADNNINGYEIEISFLPTPILGLRARWLAD